MTTRPDGALLADRWWMVPRLACAARGPKVGTVGGVEPTGSVAVGSATGKR